MSPKDVLKKTSSTAGPGQRRRPPAAAPGLRAKALLLTLVLLVATLVVGWLVWSVVEWRRGRTPAYRLLGLCVVRRDGGRRAGLCRMALRSLLCAVLVLPTLLALVVVGLAFVMGASAPDGLLERARSAPWDSLTRTEVMDERGRRHQNRLRLGGDWPTDPAMAPQWSGTPSPN